MVAHHPNRMSDIRNSLEQPTELVKEYPLSAMLILFGVGLGVGVLIGQTVANPIAHAFQPEPTMTERLSRQVYDAVSRVMPDALSRHLHS
jgi:hypothetical protein